MSAQHLVIVESPAKAKTVQSYLGPEYKVLSSFGHVRDLPKKGLSIDVEHDFEPTYEISPDKAKVVRELKQAAKKADAVWLAPDEDREGEAIAWHLAHALGLNEKTTKRIVFHEITKSAIAEAVAKPRHIDRLLVDAQQARRVLDRLVGYELSPLLWRKVRPGLSAGRVQSVAVRLIVEREREIAAFEAASDFKVTAVLQTRAGTELPAEAAERLSDAGKAEDYLRGLAGAALKVEAVEQTPGSRRPPPPLTTSTLQQEAARRLGFSVRSTMRHAQSLYEAGKITYMRTDSLNLAEQAIAQAAAVITSKYGEDYSAPTRYHTKDRSAQEAHEAVRPTDFKHETAGSSDAERRLYRLIYERTLASQMAPAKVENTRVIVRAGAQKIPLVAKGEVLIFDGFMKLGTPKDDIVLPPLKVGETLELKELTGRQTYARPPARYSESSLVRKLEELGIGRPSTYAPTISTIQDRGYVEKRELEGAERTVQILRLDGKTVKKTEEAERYGADRGKLLPTPTGEQVTDFLVEHFPDVVDYSFTAEVEDGLDGVAEGRTVWQKLIGDFYEPFHRSVQQGQKVSRADASQMRLVGHDPKTKQPIYARYGRYGPMLQRGETSDEAKPQFAPIPEGEHIDTIGLEQALKAFGLPRTLGRLDDGREVSAHIGRYGPYLKVGDDFVSLKEDDPYAVKLDRAKQVIAADARREASKYIRRFEKEGIDLINGRYGPYATDGKRNARIPKGTDPAKLSLGETKKLLAEAASRGKGRAGRRRTAAKA
jgi:DNA topoisomerase-1